MNDANRARTPIVVVGDALLDRDLVGSATRLCPDAPVPVVDAYAEHVRPGGAALAAYLAALDGRDVTLVTALSGDGRSETLRDLLAPYLKVVELPLAGTPAEKIRVRAGGQSIVRLDSGGAGSVGEPPAAVADALASARAVLVSDYGRGVSAQPRLRELLAAAAHRVPLVWDPHPRGAAPVPGARLVCPNLDEARRFASAVTGDEAGDGGPVLRAAERCARALVRRWSASAVAVTLSGRGALLCADDGPPLVAPAQPVQGVDTCGAGDRFASAVTGRLADSAVLSEAVLDAVLAASAFVAEGGAAAVGDALSGRAPAGGPDGGLDGGLAGGLDGVGADPGPGRWAREVVEQARAAGRTVVAAGGCFDLLHAGHVSTLQAARALGDCLVVCLNSDESVRRLKGPDRPLVPLEDRVRVVAALECVDAVAVFGEDTPTALLAELRPDIWAKGGDYAGATLPEAALLARWGGQAVVLPYVDGRSTTRIAAAAAEAAAGARAGVRTRARAGIRHEGVRS